MQAEICFPQSEFDPPQAEIFFPQSEFVSRQSEFEIPQSEINRLPPNWILNTINMVFVMPIENHIFAKQNGT